MIKIHLSCLLGEKKWSQADLSRKTGIRPNTINALFHEFIDRISIQQLNTICEVLECDFHDLIEYTPPKPQNSNIDPQEHQNKKNK